MFKRFASLTSPLRVIVAFVTLLTITAAAPLKPDLLGGLSWRNIGPFRAGRISAVSGAVGEPGVFYAGLPSAGVWKTTSAGETWYPVFDGIKDVSSIGAIEVAPSNSNVIYVGTGDMVTGGAINEGNGVYKSTDAGKNWKHLGLDDTKQIPSVIVDPRNPDVVMIAAQGDIHAKSAMRGVFRSTDGGATWTKTLFVNDSTGIQKLALAHDRPDVIFATTVQHYSPPPAPPGTAPAAGGGRGGRGGNGAPSLPPSNTKIFKSTDNGVTWTEITGGGLPRLTSRTSIAVAMNTNAQRVFFITNGGLYRSDDGGVNWRQMDPTDTRIRNGQGGYNCGIYVDPKNPDRVYSFATAAYVSNDGGNTFTGFRGAPGGDDAQQMWIDPTNGQRLLIGFDQGAIATLDGGQTWSSWYNQSTEQVYHVSADNSWPYWVYATQQDAGAIRQRSRGNLGAITPFDWNSVNGWEWGSIVADPLNTNTVYASGSGVVKISYPTEQWINVSPAIDPALRLRTAFSQPMAWAPWNQHELMAGFQYLMATTDGGAHWKKLSPDLGYPKGAKIPADTATPVLGAPAGGSIETISASTVAAGTIWVGTNNGLIKVTRDEGKTWSDATIPGLPYPTRALISIIDASHTDAATAYAAVDLHTSGDYEPYFFRTHDYGKTWTRIVNGLPMKQPSGSFARVIRADTKRAGLLVAGTESGMYLSFDDGDNWQSLQLNLPNTSYRDATIKGNDLVVGTYGRGIWILDDYAVLRQMTAAVADEAVHLFKPDPAIRVRRNVNADTPFPLEVPHALNPLEGVIIDYTLASKADGAVTLDVMDSAGTAIRHYSSAPIAPVDEAARPPHPNFWLATPQPLGTDAGAHRLNWDLRYDAPLVFSHSFEINANPGLTPVSPEGGLAAPGVYTIKLTVNGKSYTQLATVTNDPRSTASAADLRAQHALIRKIQNGIKTSWDGYHVVDGMRLAVAAIPASDTASDLGKAVKIFRAALDSAGGGSAGGGRGGRGGFRAPSPNFQAVHGQLQAQLGIQENGDLAPTASMLTAFASSCRDLTTAVGRLKAISAKELPAINAVLTKNGKAMVPVSATAVGVPKC